MKVWFEWYDLLAADTHTDMLGLKLTFFQYLSNFYYLFVYPTRFSSVSPSKENFFFLNTEEWKLSGHLTWNAEKKNEHMGDEQTHKKET